MDAIGQERGYCRSHIVSGTFAILRSDFCISDHQTSATEWRLRHYRNSAARRVRQGAGKSAARCDFPVPDKQSSLEPRPLLTAVNLLPLKTGIITQVGKFSQLEKSPHSRLKFFKFFVALGRSA